MADYIGFIGPGYSGQSISFDGERCVNLMLEYGAPGVTPKSPKWLTRTPGRKLFATIADPPVRGIAAGDVYLFVAGFSTLYQIDNGGNITAIGTFAQGTTPVRMFQNGGQLFLASGNQGYLQDGISLTPVVNCVVPGFMDGFFIAQQGDSNQFNISALLANGGGKSWNPLNFGLKQGNADRLVYTIADHEELFLIGKRTTEVWYNAGGPLFPFSRIQGAFIEQGAIAPWSVGKLDNSLFFLGGDDRGAGIVWRMQGYVPVRVSNHAIENLIWSFVQNGFTITDAVAYTYQENGHSVYVLNFPSADATVAYDCATQQWHERGVWDLKKGVYHMDLAQHHAYMQFPQGLAGHFVGGQQSGNIYLQGEQYFNDAGNPLRWLRACPHIDTELRWNFFRRLRIEMMVGGNNPGVPDPFRAAGSLPQIMLQVSDDGGFTWSDEIWTSAGMLGDYRYLVEYRQLGRSRDRVFRIAGADPIQIALTGADLDVAPAVPVPLTPPQGEGPAILV